MASRIGYAALTPDASTYQFPPAPVSTGSSIHSSSENTGQNIPPHENISRRFTQLVQNNTGLLLVALAQAFLAAMNVAVKKLHNVDPPVSALQLVLIRMGVTYVCSMGYMLAKNVPDPWLGPPGVRLLLFTRGFTGFFGLFGIYYSLEYLSLSDATVLTFLSPITTAIAGALLLGEVFGRREALAGILSLIGVVLIARPTFLFGTHHTVTSGVSTNPEDTITPQQRLVAVCVSMVGVLGATGAFTSIRAIGKRAHPLHSLSFFSLHCVTVSIAGMIITRTPFIMPTRLDWLALFAMIGFFGFAAQVLLTMGLQRETAGRGAMGVYMQIVFASILERIFFKSTPTWSSVLGTLIILASAGWGVVMKEYSKTDNPADVSIDMEEGAIKAAAVQSRDETSTSAAKTEEAEEREGLLENVQGEADSGDIPLQRL